MKMLILTDILTLVAIAVGAGVLLTAASRRSLTSPALLLFAALCAEIICASAASEWLHCTDWEPHLRNLGRVLEGAGIVCFIRYLLPRGEQTSQG